MGVVLPIVFCKKQHGENRKPNFRGQNFLAILKYTLHAVLKNEYIKNSKKYIWNTF